MIESLAETPAHHELIAAGGGHSRIFGPDGSSLCEPLPPDQEGILYADIDLGAIAIAKSFADPVGHYARPDVTQLLFNRAATPPVKLVDTPDLPTSGDVTEPAVDPDDE